MASREMAMLGFVRAEVPLPISIPLKWITRPGINPAGPAPTHPGGKVLKSWH